MLLQTEKIQRTLTKYISRFQGTKKDVVDVFVSKPK